MISSEYLAGFFDGDGYIGATFHRTHKIPYYGLRMSLTNIDKLFLQSVQVEYGGNLMDKSKFKLKPEHQSQYHLVWYGKEARRMAITLLPFSRIKAAQLKLAIEFPIGVRGHEIQNVPPKINKEKQKEIYLRLKQMKKEYST